MNRCCLSALRSLAAIALGLAAVAAAAAAESLPFVDATGLVTASVRYSEVVKALGEAPASEITRSAKSDHRFSYPERGLSFVIDSKERPKADPLVDSMTVTAPAEAATPQGLHVGMPQTEALRILEDRYHVKERYHHGMNSALSSVYANDAKDRVRRTLVVGFDRGAVSSLTFELQDRPWLSASTKKGLGSLFMVVLVLAAGAAWAKLRASLGLKPREKAPRPDDEERPGLLGVGVLVLVLAAVAAAAGFSLSRSGGYEAFLGLILLAGAFGGLLLGGAMLMRTGYRAAAVPGSLIVGTLLLLMIASKLLS